MERLLFFVYQYRAFFTFVVLEIFCLWLIVENNQYQGARFFNSSNAVVASINNFSQSVRDYFLLSQENEKLNQSNAELRRELEYTRLLLQRKYPSEITDTLLTRRFDFISAKVVNNQVDRVKNFITINKGSADGIEPGMAVISPAGAVGKVKKVSPHYAVVTSVLHIDYMISAVLKKTNHFGTVQWNGLNPDYTKFKFIPRHVKPVVGDTVVTSGFSGIFPQGIMIGTISEVNLSPEALTYDLTVELSQDFRKLSFVSVVRSNLKQEAEDLEKQVTEIKK